jgi:hypothetical protein
VEAAAVVVSRQQHDRTVLVATPDVLVEARPQAIERRQRRDAVAQRERRPGAEGSSRSAHRATNSSRPPGTAFTLPIHPHMCTSRRAPYRAAEAARIRSATSKNSTTRAA